MIVRRLLAVQDLLKLLLKTTPSVRHIEGAQQVVFKGHQTSFSAVYTLGILSLRVWLVPLDSCYFRRYSTWLTGSCHSGSLRRVTLQTPGTESRDQQALDAGSTTNELSNPEIPFQRSGNPVQTVRLTEIVHWVRPLGTERSSHPVSGVLSSWKLKGWRLAETGLEFKHQKGVCTFYNACVFMYRISSGQLKE